MKYRSEIDGLRALAVLPVVLFHAGFELFSGGFVGVDVFFVISGYLITSIILSELMEEKFSLVQFYERRARRILPALFFMNIACLPFVWFWLSPITIKDFGQSLFAVSIFASNFLFWSESGYFDTAAELKPLLHTWSLAVEEQYYIIFPLLLMGAWRFSLGVVLGILFVIFITSLGAAEYGSREFPNAAFYLLPTRMWELLVGAFVAFYLMYKPHLASGAMNQILSLTGLIMITASILLFDKTTPFPGLYALMPTVGTALIILCAVPATLVHRLLSLKMMVGLGLVSYSAYLLHQPVFVFARYRMGSDISDFVLLILAFVSVLGAWISWRFVEAPFRDKQVVGKEHIFTFAILGIVFCAIVGLTMHFSNGLQKLKLLSYSERERATYHMVQESARYDMYADMLASECRVWAKGATELPPLDWQKCANKYGSPVVVLGDSHAMNLYNMVAQVPRFSFVIGLAQGGCRPHDAKQSCQYDGAEMLLDEISALEPLVLFHQSGSYFIKDERGKYEPDLTEELIFEAQNVERVRTYLNRLVASGSNVVWLGPRVEYRVNPKLQPTKIQNIPRRNFKIFNEIEKDIAEALNGEQMFQYVRFEKIFPIDEETVIDDCLLWRDQDHFSKCGEYQLALSGDWDELGLR